MFCRNSCFKFGCRVFEHVGSLNSLHPQKQTYKIWSDTGVGVRGRSEQQAENFLAVYFTSRLTVNIWQHSSCRVYSFIRRLFYNVILTSLVLLWWSRTTVCAWALYWQPLSTLIWPLGGTTINLSNTSLQSGSR